MSSFLVDSDGSGVALDKEHAVVLREIGWLVRDLRFQIEDGLLPALLNCLETLRGRSEFRLALSSAKSETLKGLITVVGSDLCDVDIQLKLHSLKKVGFWLRSKGPIAMVQLVDTTEQIRHAIDLISAIAGSSIELADSPIWAATHVERLTVEALACIRSALIGLQVPGSSVMFPSRTIPLAQFESGVPENVVTCFYLNGSQVVLEVHVLQESESSTSSHSLVGLSRKRTVDNSKMVVYKGRTYQELEMVTVSSQNPMLIALMSKMTAVETQLEQLRNNISAVLSTVAGMGCS